MATRKHTLQRVAVLAAVVIAVYFAVQGGEYSTLALFKQRSRERALRASIDTLSRQVDSLRALRKAIQSDPAVQERVAREVHGLVRGEKEILYRFIDPAGVKP